MAAVTLHYIPTCTSGTRVEHVWWLTPQGRPKDGPEDKFRLTPVVPRLSELLGADVQKVDDCIGPDVEAAVKKMENGQVGNAQGDYNV